MNVMAGFVTRFPAHPACGARTKKGTKCKAPKVAGGSRCRYHGGGRTLLRRARQTLAVTRSRSVAAKCLWYIEKSVRNRSRQHLKVSEDKFAKREADAEKASQIITYAVRDGVVTPELIRNLYRLGNKLRPYREHDIHCAAGAYCERVVAGQLPLACYEAFASELYLDWRERRAVAPILGAHLVEQPKFNNPNEAIDQAFAVRSDIRRVSRRQPRNLRD